MHACSLSQSQALIGGGTFWTTWSPPRTTVPRCAAGTLPTRKHGGRPLLRSSAGAGKGTAPLPTSRPRHLLAKHQQRLQRRSDGTRMGLEMRSLMVGASQSACRWRIGVGQSQRLKQTGDDGARTGHPAAAMADGRAALPKTLGGGQTLPLSLVGEVQRRGEQTRKAGSYRTSRSSQQRNGCASCTHETPGP